MKIKTDFLVIGSGLAGLMYALKVAKHGKVVLITKTTMQETNTSYAQGGIASVAYSGDSYEKHVQDTLVAGAGLCNEKVVRNVIKEGPKMIKELIKLGTNFDKKPDGNYDLAREGGHSEPRIYHHKDNTGFEIQRAISEQVMNNENITVLENHFAIDLITQHQLGYITDRTQTNIECYGAYVFNKVEKKVYTILSKITYIGTGGLGNIYNSTTNPEIATGDGIAMVFRAKGFIENMEFVQFHPTALYNPSERPSFLITEAMRGFGGVLKDEKGYAFMKDYDERKDLAPRDIVARAIDNEMKVKGLTHVYLDCTMLNAEEIKQHFPNIYKKGLTINIDITKEMIPVVPAAHYLCGGIRVNKNGRTSIKSLYAAGETANTGLHGANRLASNSLLEAVVYADKAAKHSIKKIKKRSLKKGIQDWTDEGVSPLEEMVLITQEFRELQAIMSNYVGIVRSNLRLERALKRLEVIYMETKVLFNKSKVSVEICELRNAVNAAYLIIKMAKRRKESRGLNYNIDYPDKLIVL